MKKPSSQPTHFRFSFAMIPLLTLSFLSIFESTQLISKSSLTSFDAPIKMIEGTVPLSEELRSKLQTSLEEASQELVFKSEYFAPTALENQGDWVFVSMVGLSNIPDSQQWNISDHGTWFGHVLIHFEAGIFSQAAVVGTEKYHTLVNRTPDSLVSRQAKLELTGESQPSAETNGNIFPYPSGYRIHYGSLGVHGGWSMYGVDLGSDGNTSSGNVPNYLVASAEGTVTYKCVPPSGGTSLTIRVGNFLYSHLLGSTVSLNIGDFVSQGDYLGRLKTGTFDELPCGYASQSDNWFHVHFGFLDDPLTLGNWSLDASGTEIWTNGSDTWPISTWKRIGTSFCTTVTDVTQAECEVLRDLYYATGGGAWTDHTGWLESNQVCTWYGISCSSGQITEIKLAANNLSGRFTTNFSTLTSLSRLEISSNSDLTGNIATVIGRLPTGLNFLILRGNNLSGVIPSTISNFTNLYEIALENNALSGDLGTIIGYLPANINFLYLDGNSFTGTIPTSVSNLTHLGALTVGINQLSGDLNTIIEALPATLTFLSINDNNFSGTIPSSISSLTNLFMLDVSQNPALTGTIPVSITGLGLTLFDFQDTALCEPVDPTYVTWKANVPYYYPGPCVPPRDKAVLNAPTGTIFEQSPTYNWNEVTDATSYLLAVKEDGTKVVTWLWKSAASICSGGTCTVTPGKLLGAGNYTWWVMGKNDAGNGPWSLPGNFTIEGKPDRPALFAPKLNITDQTPAYSWEDVYSADLYLLVVKKDGTEVVTWLWKNQADICTGGTCVVDPGKKLGAGNYTFWVLAKNSYGNGFWSLPSEFTIEGTPDQPDLYDPSGPITDQSPEFTWEDVYSATQYVLVVKDSSNNVEEWTTYIAADICSAGTCSMVPVGLVLPDDSYTWQVLPKNSYGNGFWSLVESFTVTTP